MSAGLEDEIAELPKLSRAELQARWRSRLRKEPPTHLRKQLMVPLLAYKLRVLTDALLSRYVLCLATGFYLLQRSDDLRLRVLAPTHRSAPMNSKIVSRCVRF